MLLIASILFAMLITGLIAHAANHITVPGGIAIFAGSWIVGMVSLHIIDVNAWDSTDLVLVGIGLLTEILGTAHLLRHS